MLVRASVPLLVGLSLVLGCGDDRRPGADAGSGGDAGGTPSADAGGTPGSDGGATGSAAVGDPCTSAADCALPGAECFTESFGSVSWPGGFCSKACGGDDAPENECGEVAGCASIGSSGGGMGISGMFCSPPLLERRRVPPGRGLPLPDAPRLRLLRAARPLSAVWPSMPAGPRRGGRARVAPSDWRAERPTCGSEVRTPPPGARARPAPSEVCRRTGEAHPKRILGVSPRRGARSAGRGARPRGSPGRGRRGAWPRWARRGRPRGGGRARARGGPRAPRGG